VEYLEEELAMPVSVTDRGTYQEFNELLAKGDLDIAFVCGGPYVEGQQDFDLELLVIPESISGETVYYSDLIVPRDSSAQSLEDLRGKRFAFTDPQSNSGKLVPTYLLAQKNKTPEEFFGEIIYTYAHDKSIYAVMEKTVDGASVDSLIYDYLAGKDPEVAAQTKVIARSEPFGIPPVVVRPDIPKGLRAKLRTALLHMDKNPKGLQILKGMKIQRFVESDDSAYDSIRRIREFTQKQQQQATDK
jgi:phosphonate transport system substrate-binding protein